ncbi:hypothetical protein ACMHYB_33320 [Sorangium sp. So ce1128]
MIWFQYFAKPSRTAPRVVMLPTNFPVGSDPPVPVDALLEASEPPPPSFDPPVLALVVLALVVLALVVLALVVLALVVLALVVVLPAPPEPPAPPSPPPPPSAHPKRVATPSAIQVVPHSHREERFLLMLDFRKLSD